MGGGADLSHERGGFERVALDVVVEVAADGHAVRGGEMAGGRLIRSGHLLRSERRRFVDQPGGPGHLDVVIRGPAALRERGEFPRTAEVRRRARGMRVLHGRPVTELGDEHAVPP